MIFYHTNHRGPSYTAKRGWLLTRTTLDWKNKILPNNKFNFNLVSQAHKILNFDDKRRIQTKTWIWNICMPLIKMKLVITPDMAKITFNHGWCSFKLIFKVENHSSLNLLFQLPSLPNTNTPYIKVDLSSNKVFCLKNYRSVS